MKDIPADTVVSASVDIVTIYVAVIGTGGMK